MEFGEALKRVDTDATSIALRDTVCGVGLRSNRTIRRFRRAVKHVTEITKTQARFREIETVLEDEYSFVPREIFQDLLELQRVELYPDGVRQRALELLLLVMQQKRPTYYFAEELVALPFAEGKLFLRELYIFQQYGWPSNVAKLEPSRKSLDRTSKVINSTEYTESLCHTFRELLREVLKVRPALLHDVFDVLQFIFVFLGSSSPKHDGKDSSDISVHGTPLSILFDQMNPDISKARLNEWRLYSTAQDVLDFIITGPPELQRSVATSVIQTLRRSLLESSETKDDITVFSGRTTTESFLSDHRTKIDDPGTPLTPSSHRRCISVDSSTATLTPTMTTSSVLQGLPPLWFVAHLILRSQSAFNAFIEGGALEILKQLWDATNGFSFPGSSSYTSSATEDLRWVSCIVVGVISAKNPFESLFEQLHFDNQKWFYGLFRTFTSHYDMIHNFRMQPCPDSQYNDRQILYDLLLRDLSPDTEITLEDSRWDVLFLELHDRREVHIVSAMDRLNSIDLRRKTLQRVIDAAQLPNALALPKALKLASLVWLINALVQQQPESIIGVVDIKSVAFLYGSLKELPPSPYDALSLLFKRERNGQRQASQFIGYGGHELAQHMKYFLDYLGVVPAEELQIVIAFLVDSLTSILRSSPVDLPRLESDTSQSSPENNLIRCLQLLEFTSFLATSIPSSISLLLEANIIHTTLELCARSASFFPSITVDGFTGTDAMAKDLLHTQSLLLLGSLASTETDQVADKLKADSRWEHYPTLFVEATIKTQLYVRSPSSGAIAPIQALIANTMDTSPHHFLGVTNESDNSLATMITSLSLFGSDLAFNEKMNVAREIIKFVSLAPRQSWNAVFTQKVLTHHSLHRCIQFIIGEYLGCKSENVSKLEHENKMHLIRLWHRSNEYGFPESHPIDRFILLVYHIGSRLQWFTTWYSRLSDIGITTLCSQLANGSYDFEDIVDRGSLWKENMPRSQILELRKRRHDFFEEKLGPLSHRPFTTDTGRGYETTTLFPSTEHQPNKDKTKARLVLHSAMGDK